jgi:hypothetical protein
MVKVPVVCAVTVSDTVAECVIPPPVPVTVMVYAPAAVVEATAIVIVDVPEPGAAMGVGLKLTVTPVGWPVADKAIAESKPPETLVVIVDVPLLPCTTETEVGAAEMVKLGLAVAVTVSETVVVSVMLPEVPVTVTLYVPVAAEAPTVMVMVEVPAPVIDAGLKSIVTPVGWPAAVKLTAESKPPDTALVIVEVPELPCTTDTEVGEAARLKPGVDVPERALISPAFGLPQPVTRS